MFDIKIVMLFAGLTSLAYANYQISVYIHSPVYRNYIKLLSKFCPRCESRIKLDGIC